MEARRLQLLQNVTPAAVGRKLLPLSCPEPLPFLVINFSLDSSLLFNLCSL